MRVRVYAHAPASIRASRRAGAPDVFLNGKPPGTDAPSNGEGGRPQERKENIHAFWSAVATTPLWKDAERQGDSGFFPQIHADKRG